MLAFTFLLFSDFQATFKDECKFKETLLPNNYNAYESSVYKGFYVALSKHGRGKRGNKATTAMTVTHFLPRIWADSCNNSSFALISPRDLKTDTQTYKELQEYHQNSTTSFFYMYIWIGQLFIRISEYAIHRCLLLLFIYILLIMDVEALPAFLSVIRCLPRIEQTLGWMMEVLLSFLQWNYVFYYLKELPRWFKRMHEVTLVIFSSVWANTSITSLYFFIFDFIFFLFFSCCGVVWALKRKQISLAACRTEVPWHSRTLPL